jgi:hypothetical protein
LPNWSESYEKRDTALRDVCFADESGHSPTRAPCPLSANSGHEANNLG